MKNSVTKESNTKVFLAEVGDHPESVELRKLILSLGYDITGSVKFAVRPDGTWLTSGRDRVIQDEVRATKPDLIVLGHDISFSQQAKLERETKIAVLDRTGIILRVFARRARSHEGRLQVQLAQLLYQRARLVRRWSHLERQRGGFGFMAGPGERQLESDRRELDKKIRRWRQDTDRLRERRALERNHRRRSLGGELNSVMQVALVGYTNAGKSSLMNRLIDDKSNAAFCSPESFATLDPLHRLVTLEKGVQIILIDSVGFVEQLPPLLIDAFAATLEEIRNADLLIHVQDASNPRRLQNMQAVRSALKKVFDNDQQPPTIQFANKIDLVDDATTNASEYKSDEKSGAVSGLLYGSASTGAGIEELKQRIASFVQGSRRKLHLELPHNEIFAPAIAWLYRHGSVITRTDDENSAHLEVSLSQLAEKSFLAEFNSVRELLKP